MLRIAICDDEPIFASQIEAIIGHWTDKPADTITEKFTDGDTLIRAHTAAPFDIILLDVIMPLLDGIETAREIRMADKDVKIVFLTSSPEFAVDSYTVKASNYLLKPIDPYRLLACLELSADIAGSSPGLILRCPHAVYRVNLSDIEYIEAQNKHILFVLSDGRTVESLAPLYTYESALTLDDGFFRCHRSYIVNIYRIDTYTTKEIRMRSGARIPISRSCHKEFEDAYFTVLFGKAGESN